jgi:hypothetical protein
MQIRADGTRDAELLTAFRRFVDSRGGSLELVRALDPAVASSTSHAYEALSLSGFDVPANISTWRHDGDSVLEIRFPLKALGKYGVVVPDEFIDVLIEACRTVHETVPLAAVVIGEDALVAAALLDLWSAPNGPKRGDPGTLWPDDTGSLTWYPGGSISTADA